MIKKGKKRITITLEEQTNLYLENYRKLKHKTKTEIANLAITDYILREGITFKI